MNRWILWIACLSGIYVVMTSGRLAAEPVDSTALVDQFLDRSDRGASRAAFLQLRAQLLSGESQEISALQDLLCRQIAAAEDTSEVRRLCLTLAVAPRDEAILAVAGRLDPQLPPDMQRSLCAGLRYLVSHYAPAGQGTTAFALSRLESIIRDKRLPLAVVDEAVLAAGGFGAQGFDLLVGLREEPDISKKLKNVFWSALSETNDPRALPLLKARIEDGQTRTGERIQAVHAVGRMFAGFVRGGQQVDPGERSACENSLRQHLTTDAPDQLFAVALYALSKMVGVGDDGDLHQTMTQALASESPIRREAALQVLYESGIQSDAWILQTVESAATDGDQTVKETAQAILDKEAANRQDSDASP